MIKYLFSLLISAARDVWIVRAGVQGKIVGNPFEVEMHQWYFDKDIEI